MLDTDSRLLDRAMRRAQPMAFIRRDGVRIAVCPDGN
jgi:hypothetical protein